MSTKLVGCLLIVFSCRVVAAADWTPVMITGYFRARNVTHFDAAVCSRKDELNLFKHFRLFEPPIFSRSLKRFDKSLVSSNRLGIFVDVTCVSTRSMLKDASERWSDGWFNKNQTWLFWDPDDDLTSNRLILPLSTFSDVVIGTPEGLTRLRKIWTGLPYEKIPKGFWKNATHETTLIAEDERLDFRQAPVRATMTGMCGLHPRQGHININMIGLGVCACANNYYWQNIYEDMHNLTRFKRELEDPSFKPGFDMFNRFYHANILLLAHLYNYKVDYRIAESWGQKCKGGNWSGMLGMLQRDEADIAVTPMAPISYRMEVAGPALSLAPYWLGVVFRQPRTLGTYKAMTLELSSEAWACLIGLVLAGAFVFSVVQKHEPTPDQNMDGSWSMGFVQSVGIIANQGLCLVPRGTPSRIVSLSLLVVSLIVSTYYNAATLQALLSPAPPTIKTLEQLIESKIPMNFRNITIIETIDVRKRMFHENVLKVMDKPNLKLWEMHEGTRTILNGSAFLDEYFHVFLSINSQFKSDMICDLTVFNTGPFTFLVIWMKKNPHVRELHIRGLLRLIESGITQKTRHTWLSEKLNCARVTQFIHVSLEAVSVALGLFIAGVVLSISVFLLEIASSYRETRKTAIFTLKTGRLTR